MKICIPSTGKELTAMIDPRFGRAPFFLIVDTSTNNVEVIENTAAEKVQGAGLGAVELIMNHGIDTLITGRVGPKALIAIQQSGMQLIEGISSGQTIDDVLASFTKGELEKPETSTSGPAPENTCGKGMGGGRGMCGAGRGMGGGGRRRRS